MKLTIWGMALLWTLSLGHFWARPHLNVDDLPGSSGQTADATKQPSGKQYVIAPEDTLHISVWKEPELTASVAVRTDGKISLPLINDVQAAGLTPMELAGALTDKLKKFVDDPKVTVIVSQMTRPRVYVLGEVLRHGAMELMPGMTVLQVVASAGLTPFANTKKMYLLRSVDGSERKIPIGYKRLLKGTGMIQGITLRAGDTIVVP